QILGILKSGAAYLPIDLNYPEERILFILDDSNVDYLVSGLYLFAQFKWLMHRKSGNSVEFILYHWIFSREFPAAPPVHSNAGSTSPAYVIYTSGSTGKPKGVLLEHRGILNLATFHREEFAIDTSDRIIQFSSISFDASVWEIMMALLNGAALVAIEHEVLMDTGRFSDYVTRLGVTVATLPPGYADYLEPDRLQTLRILITAGSAPTPGLMSRWKNNVEYINAYGPTETSVCASVWKASSLKSGETLHNVPVGPPIPNTRIYI
ncbi:MAG: AMP-binding protein, partial [bacterium]|nr:AMP-binding protein [bacterium]